MFIESKYTNWYHSIIERAKSENRERHGRYYEMHHIIPKCMNGSDDHDNLVLLTLREHFICHLLLPKMAMNSAHRNSLYCALSYFKKCFTSHMYELYRKSHSKTMSERIWINDGMTNKRIHPDNITQFEGWSTGRLSYKKNKRMSDEARSRISSANKGRLTGASNPAAKIVIYNGVSYSTVLEAISKTGLSKYHLKKNGAIFT